MHQAAILLLINERHRALRAEAERERLARTRVPRTAGPGLLEALRRPLGASPRRPRGEHSSAAVVHGAIHPEPR